MTGPGKLLEPQVELELYDDEHVLVKVKPRYSSAPALLELVLEDAAVRDLYYRQIGLRFVERDRRLNP